MNPFGSAPASKRNSVSPPGWEQLSEEDQPLDFSVSGTTSGNAETRNEDLSSSPPSANASPQGPTASERLSPASTSPQTLTPDTSDAEASDACRKLPTSTLFANAALSSTFLPSVSTGSCINPSFSHLYQMVYPPALPPVDPNLHASATLLDPNYLHFRQKQAFLQKFSQSASNRRKRPSSASSPPGMQPSAEASSETSEHSNDSNMASTSNSRVVSPSTQSAGRRRGKAYPEEMKDEAYWERRRKNNEAAKRSRDARRAKEDETAIRAAFLEDENVKLKVHNAALQSEINKMRHCYELVVGKL